jgi:hypothetical protein
LPIDKNGILRSTVLSGSQEVLISGGNQGGIYERHYLAAWAAILAAQRKGHF